ncbi:MAG: tripartite tricarboxylate transporter substrate binding protein [Alcaligenaceae bacterium]
MHRFFIFRLFVIAALSIASSVVGAQPWPSKNIRIVLQFPPGGATDVVARILAQHMTASLGQTVIVENKPGADGLIAAEYVMRSEPDGHTFFMASNTPMMQVPLLKKNPPYDPLTSFTPVALIGRYIYVMIANSKLPFKTVPELIAYGRANPGKLNFGSHSGVTQLMFSRVSKQNDLQMNLIPYKGEAPNVNDVLGGHVQFTLVSTISTVQHINEGKLTALAVMLNKRLSLLPDTPTFAEAGLPPLGAESWAALFGPAKLPADIATRMSAAVSAAIADPNSRARIERQGFDLESSTPAELGAYMVTQLRDWKQAFADVGLKPE